MLTDEILPQILKLRNLSPFVPRGTYDKYRLTLRYTESIVSAIKLKQYAAKVRIYEPGVAYPLVICSLPIVSEKLNQPLFMKIYRMREKQ